MRILLLIPFILSFQLNAQDTSKNLLSIITSFVVKMDKINGNIYLDTSRLVCDTIKLKSDSTSREYQEFMFAVESLNLECREIDLKDISDSALKMASIQSFYKAAAYETEVPSPLEAMYHEKYVSIFDSLRRKKMSSVSELRNLESVFLSSSHWEEHLNRMYKAKKKLLTIIAVAESEELVIILYRIGALYGRMHYINKIELVVK